MTRAFQTMHTAHEAVNSARLYGYNVRNIIVQQLRGEASVRICQNDSSILIINGSILYTGRPTHALAHIAFEFALLAS